MIQRLTTTLRAIGTRPLTELSGADQKQLFGDCADAVRLELDCPQQALTALQRSALTRLSDLLESSGTDSADVASAARWACEALGLGEGGY